MQLTLTFNQNGRISPRTSSKGDAGSKHSVSPSHSSPLQMDFSQTFPQQQSSTPNLHLNRNTSELVLGVAEGEKRSIAGSQLVQSPRLGFKDGGVSGITKITEAEEPAPI